MDVFLCRSTSICHTYELRVDAACVDHLTAFSSANGSLYIEISLFLIQQIHASTDMNVSLCRSTIICRTCELSVDAVCVDHATNSRVPIVLSVYRTT